MTWHRMLDHCARSAGRSSRRRNRPLLVPALITTVRRALRTAYVNLMSSSSGVPGFGVEAAEEDGLGTKLGAIGTGRAANIVVVARAASVLRVVFMPCGHPVVQSHHLVERRMHRKNPSDRGHGDCYPARSPERKIGRRRERVASRAGDRGRREAEATSFPSLVPIDDSIRVRYVDYMFASLGTSSCQQHTPPSDQHNHNAEEANTARVAIGRYGRGCGRRVHHLSRRVCQDQSPVRE